MRVVLDESLCVGHGRCYALAPEVYDSDDHGHCMLRFEDVPDDLHEQARLGVTNCPEDALSIDAD
jgi:ferredoxin